MGRKSLFAPVLAGLVLTVAAARGAPVAPPPPPAEAASIPHVLLVDVGSGQTLYARAPDQPFLPASTTKAMTAYLAFELIDAGKLRPTTMFQVSDEVERNWSGRGTTLWLKAGERIDVDTLLRGIAVISANDGAVALAEGYAGDLPTWLLMMNAEARRLGMSGSRFGTPNGLPDEGYTVVTARDMVRLGTALVERHPALYRTYFGQPAFLWRGAEYRNRDPLIGMVAGADGIKTGHTEEAGYNFLGSAERDGRRLMMMVAGAASGADRAAASRALLEWGFSQWRARPLFNKGQLVGNARVQEGNVRAVGLVAERNIYATIPATSQARLSLNVNYRGPLAAPIAKGAHIADLRIMVDGLPAGTVPLVAASPVGRAGPLDRLVNGVLGWFT
jgi:D-alanyl-D-alanine carboxypeptidase (penicillin-binding protein 5/6)